MNSEKNPVEILNDLLEKNYDAEQGYQKAAEEIESSLIKAYLQDSSKNRYDFGHEIKEEIKKLGGKPEKGTSLVADLHRKWMDLRSVIAGNNDKAIIAECEKGEKAALQDYEIALNSGKLPESAQSVVSRQYEKIKTDLMKLENMENILSKD
ncbi:MAG: PA2169 family four-helix-bundle protein [Bacteroidota bacterium]|jgi:uncharacterized protein (TIGR02284 family)|nr:PA2169 family four-helix-bundle protein [Bacteroidota bacterium]